MYSETERLTIRDPILDDWHGAHAFLSDPMVMSWIHLGPRQWITDLIYYNQQQPRDSHNALIVERATHHIVGWIGIGKPSPHRATIGDLDFGYALAQPHWNKGYMSEAVTALLKVAFTELGANRVFAICEVQNIGSYRVMEKAGMQREQCFTEPDPNSARLKEMYLYTLSKADWSAHHVP